MAGETQEWGGVKPFNGIPNAVFVIGLYELLGNPTTLLIEPRGPLYI
jgi:hypothetical protein